MESWKDFPARYAHYQELVEEAEQERRIRLVLAGTCRRSPFLSPLLAWIGRRLVIWGSRLQLRYGFVDTA
jgi:hypothetical protein